LKDSYFVICAGGKGEIYRTVDGGSSWKLIATQPGAIKIAAADPAGEHLIALANGPNRLIESYDSGRTWKKIDIQFEQPTKILDFSDPRQSPFYIAAGNGVLQRIPN